MNSEDSLFETTQQEPQKQLSPLTIATGLRAVANDIYSSKTRKGLLQLSSAIEGNSTVDNALMDLPNLPEDLREIVRAGVQTGRLPFLLEEYLSTNRKTQSLWKNFYLSIIYPLFVLLFSMVIVTAFLLLAVPQFKEIFNDFGVELPVMTRAMISLTDFLAYAWLPALFSTVILSVVFLIRGVLPFAAMRAKIFQALPWIGTAQKMAAASEFCSRLAILVECRLPLDESLQIVAKSVRDPYMKHVTKRLASRVEAGESAEDLASYSSGMPPALINAFRWSNDPAPFADGLRSLAIVFGSQARLSTSHLVFIAEPFAFIGVATMVGLVVLSMFMPLINLLNQLS